MFQDKINRQSLSILTTKQARYYKVIPFSSINGCVSFYTSESSDLSKLKQELSLITGKKILLEKIVSEKIDQLLSEYYPNEQIDSRQQSEFYQGKTDDFLRHLIIEARNLKSSDIHLEIFEESCRVRVRIDGLLVIRYIIGKSQYPALVNKIKITANLDISEKRLPQDGRILFEIQNDKFDIRVSVLPTLHGEKVVLRLLNNDVNTVNIHSLGFSDFDLNNFLESVRKPNGIVLISGPTGSGKTTTLYATLKLLNKESRNILTIEDPIEYTLEGVNQVQLRDNIGLSFAATLKTFLRQDPDIIMLGEIRDVETANMAIRAALTGHLVLSTIHTNSAWGIIARLIDMGIPPYLLANTINTAVAQRLVRLLCNNCKEKAPIDLSKFPRKFKAYSTISEQYVPKGCVRCFNTGYKGRKAVYEVIPIDNEFADAIKSNSTDSYQLMRDKGIRTISENAYELLAGGETSLEEIYTLLMN